MENQSPCCSENCKKCNRTKQVFAATLHISFLVEWEHIVLIRFFHHKIDKLISNCSVNTIVGPPLNSNSVALCNIALNGHWSSLLKSHLLKCQSFGRIFNGKLSSVCSSWAKSFVIKFMEVNLGGGRESWQRGSKSFVRERRGWSLIAEIMVCKGKDWKVKVKILTEKEQKELLEKGSVKKSKSEQLRTSD